MRDLNLPLEKIRSIVLAADVRFGPTDYINDHIWEITSRSGDPPGLTLSTNYGLRAKSFRLFPRVTERGVSISNPTNFESQPFVQKAYPNYVKLTFAPFAGIDVTWEVWVPGSHAVSMKFKIRNNGVTTRNLRVELITLLIPGNQGHRMVETEIGGSIIMAGETMDLFPVILQVGGGNISQGPLPGFYFDISLLPGTFYEEKFVEFASQELSDSVVNARNIAERSWDAEIAKIELINRDKIHIHTGDTDWNHIFWIAQQIAGRLFMSSTEKLPFSSFVLARQPDQGYSPRGDGSDYDYLWNGQTPLHSYYLSTLMLPSYVHYLKNLVRNFLFSQDQQSGFVDWKPGLGGQRSYLLATPILAWLVWQIYQYQPDIEFLKETFEPLNHFFNSWFNLRQDVDGDGIPEWDHPAQLGFESHPFFSNAESDSDGADISAAESPALCAFLYQECRALINIAETLDQISAVPALLTRAENLHVMVATGWDSSSRIYRLRDRDTHESTRGENLGQLEGNGSLPIRQKFSHPTRLVLKINAATGLPPKPLVTVFGTDASGNNIERIILPERWQWFLENGSVTTNDLFGSIDSLKIQGLEDRDILSISSYDYYAEDLSLTFPLIAEMSSPAQAKECIEKSILDRDRFWKPFGFAACVEKNSKHSSESISQTLMIWNTLVGEALLKNGYRVKAAELVSHLMEAMSYAIQDSGVFYTRYSSLDGSGTSEINTLDGLPPIGLFLNTLGVQIFSPWKVHLEGSNPFPWPVKLNYRGLTVDRRSDKTIITFPDGQTVTVDDPHPCTISSD